MDDILKFFKNNNKKYIVLVLLGIVILVFSSLNFDVDKSDYTEKKLKQMLEETEGVGKVDVMITYDENKIPKGIIVAADGAENADIKKIIHDSAAAVLNVPDYKIQILTKKK